MNQQFFCTKGLLIIILTLLICSCKSKYDIELENWRAERLEELKQPYGWPSVTGLFRMENSSAYFGSKDNNDFIVENAATGMGWIERKDSSIILHAYQSLRVQVDGETIVSRAILKTDQDENGPSIASWRSLQWHVIEREGVPYLRVKDTLSPYRLALTDIPHYENNESFRITATKLEKGVMPNEISYSNVLGMNLNRPVADYLKFDWNGEEHVIAALKNNDQSYFVMIYDETTGLETYGGGRYLYPERNDESNTIILDFNKLENPPCVFTPFATCSLPPDMNRLPFKVEAGEKDMHLY